MKVYFVSKQTLSSYSIERYQNEFGSHILLSCPNKKSSVDTKKCDFDTEVKVSYEKWHTQHITHIHIHKGRHTFVVVLKMYYQNELKLLQKTFWTILNY